MNETWGASLRVGAWEPTDLTEKRKSQVIATGLSALADRVKPGMRYTLLVGEWREFPTQYGEVELRIEIEIFSNRPFTTPLLNFSAESDK